MTPLTEARSTSSSKRLRVGSVLMLYIARLRRRWAAETMAVVGIAAGVALLYAANVASTSLSAPVQSLLKGIVGNSQIQLISRGSARMPEQTYKQVIALPGVRRAAPVLQVPGNLIGPAGDHGVMFFGADPRIVKLRGNLLQGFKSADAARQEALVIPSPVARTLGVRFGDEVRLGSPAAQSRCRSRSQAETRSALLSTRRSRSCR